MRNIMLWLLLAVSAEFAPQSAQNRENPILTSAPKSAEVCAKNAQNTTCSDCATCAKKAHEQAEHTHDSATSSGLLARRDSGPRGYARAAFCGPWHAAVIVYTPGYRTRAWKRLSSRGGPWLHASPRTPLSARELPPAEACSE